MKKEFKLKTNYFDGRKISDYGVENGKLDYGTGWDYVLTSIEIERSDDD